MTYYLNMNITSSLDPQTPEQKLAQPEYQELPYEGAGFPGCGDGSDDLADYNQMEAMDYDNE